MIKTYNDYNFIWDIVFVISLNKNKCIKNDMLYNIYKFPIKYYDMSYIFLFYNTSVIFCCLFNIGT